MTPAERISSDTWNRLMQARALDVRLGEETLTDLLLLDLKPHESTYRIHVFQSTKQYEALYGTDLEILVRDRHGRTYRYAIQAKKIDYGKSSQPKGPSTATRPLAVPSIPWGRYRQIDKRQLDRLELHARRVGAIPCYLLYNYASPSPCSSSTGRYWHCCDCSYCGTGCDDSQFGCTLAPSWVIRNAINPPRGNRNFDYVHQHHVVLPWRCLFDCLFTPLPPYLLGIADLPSEYAWVTNPTHHTWPAYLLRKHKESENEFIQDYCNWEERPEEQHRPRRLLLIDRQLREPDRADR